MFLRVWYLGKHLKHNATSHGWHQLLTFLGDLGIKIINVRYEHGCFPPAVNITWTKPGWRHERPTERCLHTCTAKLRSQYARYLLHYRVSTPHFRPIIIFNKHILMILITSAFSHSLSTLELWILVKLSMLITITGLSTISFYIHIFLLFSYIFPLSHSFISLLVLCATSLGNNSPKISLVEKFFFCFCFT